MDKDPKSMLVRVAAYFTIVRSTLAITDSATFRSWVLGAWHWFKD
jgi:hypothetical protein